MAHTHGVQRRHGPPMVATLPLHAQLPFDEDATAGYLEVGSGGAFFFFSETTTSGLEMGGDFRPLARDSGVSSSSDGLRFFFAGIFFNYFFLVQNN